MGSARPGNSWDRREGSSFGNAFIETVKEFATAPQDAWSRTRETGDMLNPLIFAGIIYTVVTVMGQIWSAMFGGSILAMLPSEYHSQLAPYMTSGGGCIGFALGLVSALIAGFVALFLWIALLHLSTLVVGGMKGSKAGFEGTLRVVSFASVAQLAGIIPFVGGLVAFVWSMLLLITGISNIHRTSTGTAVLAVVLPLVVCCVCVAGIIVMMAGSIAAIAGSGG